MNKLLKIIEPIILLLVPVCLVLCAFFNIEQTLIISTSVVIISIIPFFLRFEHQKPRPRDIMPIVIFAAIASAGRIIFAPFPSFKPIGAITIMGGVCFGRQSGFLIGALTSLASNMFFGQGPWTPWQMYALGIMGYFAGAIAQNKILNKPFFIYVYGFISSLLYGFILDSYSVIGYISPLNLASAAAAYIAGVPFTLSFAAATAVFLLIIYKPWIKKINRLKIKYEIMQ